MVSIGICAYNEAANIGRLLQALHSQRLERVTIKEILVISSGSTDNTEAIVHSYGERDRRIKLVAQPARQGKAAAINAFLEVASGELCMLVSADVVPESDTVEKMCQPFGNETVGMVGGRVIPVNPRNSFMGFAGHMLWDMHHRIALKRPKLGEMVAFRNVLREIPVDTATDEAYIEAAITHRGLTLKYVPQAVVYNKAPETVADFLRQRRRIYAGHLDLRERFQYSPATLSPRLLLPLALSYFSRSPRRNLWALGALFLEAYARWLGWHDYKIKKTRPTVWQVASTTKRPVL